MLIDWFTVGAQTLNFLILVWLLKRFLYKPILDAIDVREKRIASELADADAKKAAASKESEDFQRKNQEFDQQRAALMNKATDEVKVERQRLLDEARQAAAALHTKLQDALKSEQQNLSDEIGRRTREEVFAIARKALIDLSGMTLEQRVGEVFMQRLQTLGEVEKADFAKSIKSSSDPVLLRSASALLPVQKTAIQEAINKTFSDDIQIRFETVPDMIGGIALSANGKKIAWNIADYLDRLGESVNVFLKEQVADKNKAEVKEGEKSEEKDDKKDQKTSTSATIEQ